MFDPNKFADKAHTLAEKSGEHIKMKIHALPDNKLIQLAREGNAIAQEEANRRHLSW